MPRERRLPFRRPAALALLFVTVGGGCSRRATPASIAPDPPDLPDASVSSAAPSAAASIERSPSVLVGSDAGLREVGYDGTVLRTLTKTAARRPRVLPGGKEVVFYAPVEGEVRRLSLETGAERRLAALPRSFKVCLSGRGSIPQKDLAIQEDGDFVVDAGAGAVCVTLMDRNAGMVSVQVQARVDMTAGSVAHRVSIGGDCLPKTRELPSCKAPPDTPRAAKAAPFPLAALGVPATAQEETVSPSGRWSVLGIVTGEGDYVHRSLFLVDRIRKSVHPIAAGAFRAKALTAAQRRALGDFQGTVDAVGETSVRWLEEDALLVDALLVVPGKGGVDLGGDVAR